MSNDKTPDNLAALKNLITVMIQANEMTRNQVNANSILTKAIFDVLTSEQKEKVLTNLEKAVTNPDSPSAITGVSAEIYAELSLLLPALAKRRKLS